MRKFTTRDLTLAAIVAAVYAVLTLTLPIPQFTGIQVRLSEALTVLPFLLPATAPGLVVGCFIANLFSPYSLDVIFGTAATLIACILTRHMPNRYLAPLPPVLCNAVIVGAECAWYQVGGFGPAFWPAYAFNAFTVGVGELAACYILGSLLLNALPQLSFFRELIPQQRLERLHLGLENRLNQKVGALSGGQRQALALLLATMTPIDILVLDEHTAALDPKSSENVMRLTDELVREKQLTTIMVTHNLKYAVEYGSRLIMMHGGAIVEDRAGREKQELKVSDLLTVFNAISVECGN